MSTVNVTDSSFSDSVLNSDKPVLVDFWAEWCGPCKAITPVLEEIAQSMGERVTVQRSILTRTRRRRSNMVSGDPTLILFKDGQVAATKMGAIPKHSLNNGWTKRSDRGSLITLEEMGAFEARLYSSDDNAPARIAKPTVRFLGLCCWPLRYLSGTALYAMNDGEVVPGRI